jgi:Tfp pilus assembly protein PilN
MSNPFAQHRSDAVSFLPEDYVARKSETRANLLCLSLFGVVMFGVVGAFFVTNRQWLSVRAEQETINKLYTEETQKIEQLKVLEEQKMEMLQKAEITTALIEKVPRSVLLAELVNRMPPNITLESFNLKSKRINQTPPSTSPLGKPVARVKTLTGVGAQQTASAAKTAPAVKPPSFEYTLVLTGVATINQDITDYVSNLGESPLLSGIELNFIEETVKNDIEMRKFEIGAVLRPDADARSIEAPATLQLGGAEPPDKPEPDSNGDVVTAVPDQEEN